MQAHRWLYASVVVADPPALRFEVNPPAAWDAVLSTRVARHFRTLGLAALYAAEAADELLNIRHQLQDLHAAGGLDLVRREMEDRAESCGRVRINSWRVATFEAFANSDWFCNGGFN